ncbi:paeninodin family lasso peptide [Bacillus cereus]|uniref:Paeninodin family lasso peptide n=1 Tax=Bacillus mycoides TaxID=1405 RepID=A0A3D9U819_BACMY|nr:MULTISPECIES: paeninodin family lasso peptide [Bacillus]EKS7852515.1 paeninodin family lasso peptide [Bacillus wiedmannii]RFB68379.1 paeninodin family lasso peptide [Bacillus sp. AW]NEL00912.1 paeninodin family lasso peptide [Bacillus mobilis]RBP27453.1 hypothetical protein DET63_106274 [Bacillus sp. DB-2]REF25366.1 hypothetical protein DET55_12332 [Bacillus mycoides]
MKKEWKTPVLEVLDVNMTMLDPKNGRHLDHTYEAGTDRDDLTWS